MPYIAAFIVGLITALIGARPGMISGATGALAVVMVALVAQHGIEYLFATVVLMGVIQIIVGAMRWGKFIRLVPHPVMLGFVNGLAIVIFMAQLSQFKGPGIFDKYRPWFVRWRMASWGSNDINDFSGLTYNDYCLGSSQNN